MFSSKTKDSTEQILKDSRLVCVSDAKQTALCTVLKVHMAGRIGVGGAG